MTDLNEYIEANTLRCDVSRRGGGIEIDAAEYLQIPFARMAAYQNYLGGGMLGSVQASMNGNIAACKDKRKLAKAEKLAEALKRYFHELTNAEAEDWDEWATSDYEQNQNRSISAY